MSDQIIVKAPEAPKSWVQTFVERAKGTAIEKAEPKSIASYGREAWSTVGDYAVSGVVGSLLGATHAKFGLDTKGGPIDGWISGIGAIAAIGLSGYFPNAARSARKIGGDAFTILSFRKAFGVVKHEPLPGAASGPHPGVTRVAAPAAQVAGEEDPIEKAARGLG